MFIYFEFEIIIKCFVIIICLEIKVSYQNDFQKNTQCPHDQPERSKDRFKCTFMFWDLDMYLMKYLDDCIIILKYDV